MIESKIEELREKLHALLSEKAEYNKVLRVSQELDEYITEFTTENLTGSWDVRLCEHSKIK